MPVGFLSVKSNSGLSFTVFSNLLVSTTSFLSSLISKTKGMPTINYGTNLSADFGPKKLPVKSFPKKIQYKNLPLEKTDAIEDFFKWLLKLSF